ncbi:MAG: hypothetical protein AAGF98_12815 [Cyanobacteria bacterium P01_H01_bin.153]
MLPRDHLELPWHLSGQQRLLAKLGRVINKTQNPCDIGITAPDRETS